MPSPIHPGIVAVHSNRTEDLARMLAEWMRRHPLEVLEQDVLLVQSNGMAEWLKMALARELGISAAVQVELPGRFAWRMYRQVLGARQVPYQTPLDKPDMLWRLMQLLPALLGQGAVEGGASADGAADGALADVWQPLRRTLAAAHAAPGGGDRALALYQLALRIADVLDQYQVYRPDWLHDWAQGRAQLAGWAGRSAQPLPEQAHWQAAIWRALLQSLAAQDAALAEAIRPRLHQRVLARLQQGHGASSPLPRRVVLFGVSHIPLPIMQLLVALGRHSQVLLAIPDPCKEYWSDAIDGRELFARAQRQGQSPASHRADRGLADVPLHAMHVHANPLLTMWGRQVRDFVRLLEHYEQQEQPGSMQRIDLYVQDEADAAPTLLRQVQNQIRDFLPLPASALTDTLGDSGRVGAASGLLPIAPGDDSICFQSAHSPVRELEALRDHLLERMLADVPHAPCSQRPVAPREVVVMVPDIGQYAPLIRAVFDQYPPGDSRHIPFDIADLGAEDVSALVQAVQWLTRLPEQRVGLSELGDLLAVPAVAQRLGLDEDDVAQLQAWMRGSGIRWGIDAAHRARLGVPHMGEQNTAWFGLQRMLLAYASGQPWQGVQPYAEVGGLAAASVGALAWLIERLQYWSEQLASPATAVQWGQRWRALLGDFLVSAEQAQEADRAALAMLEKALQQWLDAALRSAGQGDDAAPQPPGERLPLSVARHAWISQWRLSGPQQRFHAGGVTFCTLLPMRAIPFRIVCLLGMNEGVYPRVAPPDEMDLMRLPGMLRPGDRSRAQDDRQLMLEALLAAREQLLISWVGRSVRDNSECPPSVLVAQLRDYLAACWGGELVRTRTREHPLQAFNPRYFLQPDANAPEQTLHTWAHEWQGVAMQAAAAQTSSPPAAPQPAPLDTWTVPSAQALPPVIWNVDSLAALWRNPARQWFATRLQTRFAELPEWLDDCEPLTIGGLERWEMFDALMQQLLPLVQTPGATLQGLLDHAQAYWHSLQRQGRLPLGEQAKQLQQEWMEQSRSLLEQWLRIVRAYPRSCATRQLLQWPGMGQAQGWAAGQALRQGQEQEPAAPRVQDWAPVLHLPPSISEDNDPRILHQHGRYLHVLPFRLCNERGKIVHLKPLITPWLQAVLLAAGSTSAGQGDADGEDDADTSGEDFWHGADDDTAADTPQAWAHIIALDAVLEIEPLPPAQAQQWLADIVALADQAQAHPLPFDFATAHAWLQERQKNQARSAPQLPQVITGLRSAQRAQIGQQAAAPVPQSPSLPDFKALKKARASYDGWGAAAPANPYTARIWPNFDALHASGQFETLAQSMLGPLQQWVQQCVRVMPAAH